MIHGINIYGTEKVTLVYRHKILRDEMTLKQEGLSGGELLTLYTGAVPVQDGDPGQSISGTLPGSFF